VTAALRNWVESAGEIFKFCGRVLGDVYSLRVLRFFGETLRQPVIVDITTTDNISLVVFIYHLR
jgi:phospholipid/cholesterol/gamma-HCH transport system permease protein